jgi:hypothetical protein
MIASVKARAPRAHHHRHLVAHDQLLGDRGRFGRVALVVLDHQLDLLAEHAALGVDLVGGDLGAVGDIVSRRRERAGQRLMTPTLMRPCAAAVAMPAARAMAASVPLPANCSHVCPP